MDKSGNYFHFVFCWGIPDDGVCGKKDFGDSCDTQVSDYVFQVVSLYPGGAEQREFARGGFHNGSDCDMLSGGRENHI